MRSGVLTGRTLAIGAVAALIGVGVGVVVVMTTRHGSRDQTVLTAMDETSEDAAASAMGSAAPSDGGDGAAEAADTAAAQVSEAAAADPGDAPTTDAGEVAQTAALVPLCADVTARRDEAVLAAEVALGNWKTHYGAQQAFDRGEISSDEAKRRWADSKAPAQRNLADLSAAVEAIGSGAPCTQLVDDGALSGTTAGEVEACVTRSDRAVGALDAAQEPLQGWRDHLRMMDAKDEYSTEEYLRRWDRMVSAAPGEMRPFDQAVADWRDAPACDPSA